MEKITKKETIHKIILSAIINTLVVIIVSQMVLSISASQGPNSAGLANDFVSGFGTRPWAYPTRVYSSDNSRTYSTSDETTYGDRTHYLNTSNFGFSIPSGATITGISANVERYCNFNYGTNYCIWFSVYIMKDGAFAGTQWEEGLTQWGTSESYQTIANSTHLWGTTWTAADINAANFGIALKAKLRNDPETVTAYIDHVQLTVYYTIDCTSGDCCNTTSGLYMPSSYNPTGTCNECSGSSNVSNYQSSAEDIFGECANSYSCSGQNIINNGLCNSAGACGPVIATCSNNCNSLCVSGSGTCYDTANGDDTYNICSGGYTCSGNNIINGALCGTSTACGYISATCTGNESNRCVTAQSTCQNLCSNSLDDDSDTWVDDDDQDCSACAIEDDTSFTFTQDCTYTNKNLNKASTSVFFSSAGKLRLVNSNLTINKLSLSGSGDKVFINRPSLLKISR